MGTLNEGAKNAVKVCMAVKRGEHVLIVTDKAQYEVANALRQSSEKITSGNTKLFVLEDYGKRPMLKLPKKIENSVHWANVTFYVATNIEGEIIMRNQFIKTAVKYARHAHMSGITRQIMEDGMCVDYSEVSKLSHKIYDIVKDVKTARMTCPNGTDINIKFNPSWRWEVCDGFYHKKGKWGNLPDGEVFTAPFIVNGRISCILLGDYFDNKYGVLNEPLHFEIKDSRVNLEKITNRNIVLIKELKEYLRTDKNSNRVSEFAIPTNFVLIERSLIGNLLQDEKARVHLAFGDPYPEDTKADWKSKTHLDCLIEKSNVWVDKKQIMKNGKYII